MGFYQPAQIVRDAREHGVEIRPLDVNASRWDSTLEPAPDGRLAVRLGLRMAKGLANKDGARIVAARADASFSNMDDLWQRSSVPVLALERLANADAFRSLSLSRREALWAIRALRDEPLPLFAAAARHEAPATEMTEPAIDLRPMTAGREVVEDYSHLGLTLREHPIAFLRDELAERRIVTCAEVTRASDGRYLTVAGLVLVRQKPGSAKGVMFVTIEDETGNANLVIWPKIFEKNRRTVLSAGMLAVRGRVQREGEVVHLVADRLTDLSARLHAIGDMDGFRLPHGRGDEAKHGGGPDARSAALGRKPRDIYIPDLRLGSGIKVQTRDFR
jgi:error-prone DNA polymerase